MPSGTAAARRRAGSRAGGGCAAGGGLALRGLAVGRRRALTRACGARTRGGSGLRGAAGLPGRGTRGRGLAAAVAEIGHVPARTLQLESGRGDELLEVWLVAGRTLGERCIGELLQRFEFMPAGRASVFVDRHVPSHDAAPQGFGEAFDKKEELYRNEGGRAAVDDRPGAALPGPPCPRAGQFCSACATTMPLTGKLTYPCAFAAGTDPDG